MSKSKTLSKQKPATPIVLSADEVIARLISMLKAIPEAVAELPVGYERKEFWERHFASTAKAGRMLEMLREMPGFTELAPRDIDAKGDGQLLAKQWRAVFERDFQGPPKPAKNSLISLVEEIVAAANPPVAAAKTKYWRDCFGPSVTFQRVRPTESNDYLPNPHRGTATFQRFQGDDLYAGWSWSDTHGPLEISPNPSANSPLRDNIKYVPRTTVSYCRWPWAWLEPKRGTYNWRLIDQALAAAKARGQTLQARFQPYTARVDFAIHPTSGKRHPPRVSVNVPDWYWDTGASWIPKGPYAEHEPDSNDPKYIQLFGSFIRAFAKRYDGHPDLESIDVAYAGFWGESGGNATAATGEKLVEIYLRAFKKTQLLSLIGMPGCKTAELRTRGTPHHVGWRADCIGDLRPRYKEGCPPELAFNHTHDCYPRLTRKFMVQDAWKTAPVTLETCWAAAQWFVDDIDLDVIMREAMRYHVSVFMPKSVFYPQAIREKLIEFDKKIGYRFVLRQLKLPLEFKPGSAIDLELFIDNVGCAPIYRDYALAVRFRQGNRSEIVRLKNNLRDWQPGHTWFEERIKTPKSLKPGEVKIDLAIVDDENMPKVWFAITGETVDGWHPMTSMDVAKSAVANRRETGKPMPMTT